MFLQILSKVSILFITLFIGALARYKNILTKDSTKSLAKVVLVVTLPFLYFYSLATQFTKDLFREIWPLPIFAICLICVAYTMAKILSRFINLDSLEWLIPGWRIIKTRLPWVPDIDEPCLIGISGLVEVTMGGHQPGKHYL